MMAPGSFCAAAITLAARASLAMNPSTKSFTAAIDCESRSVTAFPRLSVHMRGGGRGRLRPRPLLAANDLEGAGDLQHAQVVEAPARDLHADGQAAGRETAIDRRRRLLGHVVRHGEADVLQRAHR